MGGASIWHWMVVGLIVMLLFGRGKISEMMGDVAKGIKAFKKGMSDEDEVATVPSQATTVQTTTVEPVRSLDHQGMPSSAAASSGAIHPSPSTAAPLGPTHVAGGTTTLGDRKVG